MVYLPAQGHTTPEKARFYGVKERQMKQKNYFDPTNDQELVILKSSMILELIFYLDIKYSSGYFN